ncbi:8427_t:CDS:2 [Funneliformis mosseae]|uniref:8427_t:CDS:1 n=1 Tax=Funneliformis mosseae TaxID=27381 RepID=A0A9N9GF79_FUNMO|nr:8427_t:CDS:2 [Funneliformis mosseae]
MISKPPAIDDSINHEQPPVHVNTTNGQQLLPFPVNENIMATSSIINRRSSLQNLDDVLENFKNDMLHVFDRRTEKETCMRYVISPQYNQGAYRGYFSLNDNSTLFTFPKLNEERLHSLTLQVVADFNTS